MSLFQSLIAMSLGFFLVAEASAQTRVQARVQSAQSIERAAAQVDPEVINLYNRQGGLSQRLQVILERGDEEEMASLLLPAVQRVREAEFNGSGPSHLRSNVEGDFTGSGPSRTLSNPEGYTDEDTDSRVQTREHVLLSRQVGVPAAASEDEDRTIQLQGYDPEAETTVDSVAEDLQKIVVLCSMPAGADPDAYSLSSDVQAGYSCGSTGCVCNGVMDCIAMAAARTCRAGTLRCTDEGCLCASG